MKKVFMGLLLIATVASAGEKLKTKRNPAQHGTGNIGAALDHELIDASSARFKGPREPRNELDINSARLDSVTMLVNKDFDKKLMNLQVKVIVSSTGAASDVSPRKQIIFAIYSENEMFDVKASYIIGSAFSVKSAKRISGGIYEIRGALSMDDFTNKKTSTIQINAISAINELEKIEYTGENGEPFPELNSEVIVTPKP